MRVVSATAQNDSIKRRLFHLVRTVKNARAVPYKKPTKRGRLMGGGDSNRYHIAERACAIRQMNDELNGCRSVRRCFRRNLGIHLIKSGVAWSQAGKLHFGCQAVDQHIQFWSQVHQGIERCWLPLGQVRRNRAESGCVDRDEISRVDWLACHAVYMFHGHSAGVGNQDSALTGTRSVEREYARRRVSRCRRERGRGSVRAYHHQGQRGTRRQLRA